MHGEGQGAVSKGWKMPSEKAPQGMCARNAHFHAAAAQSGNSIHLLHRGRFMTLSVATYHAWRQQNKTVRVMAEEGFEYDKDAVFEDTLSPLYKTLFSWRKVLLDGWWFDRNKTGLMTMHERLAALIEIASMSPDVGT